MSELQAAAVSATEQQIHFLVSGVLTQGISSPAILNAALCLRCLDLSISVHPGPLPPVVPDADSPSRTPAPLSLLASSPLVVPLTHFDSPGPPRRAD